MLGGRDGGELLMGVLGFSLFYFLLFGGGRGGFQGVGGACEELAWIKDTKSRVS